jgi:hypothetical protein
MLAVSWSLWPFGFPGEVVRVHRVRNPELRLPRRKAEGRRHDADDGVRTIVERDLAPDDARIRAKDAAPQSIAQNQDRFLAVGADPEADDEDRREGEAARAAQRARGVAQILLEDVPMDGGGIHDDLLKNANPQRQRRERPVRVAQAVTDDGGH